MRLANRLFLVLALAGLAAFLAFLGVVLAHRASDETFLQGDTGWFVVFAGMIGGQMALLFGALAFLTRQPAAPRSDRRTNALAVAAALVAVSVAFVLIESFVGLLAALTLAVAAVVIYLALRGRPAT